MDKVRPFDMEDTERCFFKERFHRSDTDFMQLK